MIPDLCSYLTQVVNQHMGGYVGMRHGQPPRFQVDVFGSMSWGGQTGQTGDIDMVVRVSRSQATLGVKTDARRTGFFLKGVSLSLEFAGLRSRVQMSLPFGRTRQKRRRRKTRSLDPIPLRISVETICHRATTHVASLASCAKWLALRTRWPSFTPRHLSSSSRPSLETRSTNAT